MGRMVLVPVPLPMAIAVYTSVEAIEYRLKVGFEDVFYIVSRAFPLLVGMGLGSTISPSE